MVHSQNPRLPILGLMDFDPDGLYIFHCYCYGSRGLNLFTSPILGILWLGIKSSQLLQWGDGADRSRVGSGRQPRHAGSALSLEPMIYLSHRDRKAAIGTLSRLNQEVEAPGNFLHLRRELQVMLMMGVKAEIQQLDDGGNLAEWLDSELENVLAN